MRRRRKVRRCAPCHGGVAYRNSRGKLPNLLSLLCRFLLLLKSPGQSPDSTYCTASTPTQADVQPTWFSSQHARSCISMSFATQQMLCFPSSTRQHGAGRFRFHYDIQRSFISISLRRTRNKFSMNPLVARSRVGPRNLLACPQLASFGQGRVPAWRQAWDTALISPHPNLPAWRRTGTSLPCSSVASKCCGSARCTRAT